MDWLLGAGRWRRAARGALALGTALQLLGLALPDRAAAQAKSEAETQQRLAQRNYARGGFYLGAEGLYAVENSPVVGPNDQFISSGGFDIRLGHRHNRWFATELMGFYVHTFADRRSSYLAWGMMISERFYLTKGRFQPYLTAGLGFLQPRPRDEDFDRDPNEPDFSPGFTPGFSPRFGVGFEAYTNEDFAFTFIASYHLTVGNIKDLDFITAGFGIQWF